jgi:fructose-1,6-bisphosphatase/sedoheptulose 1,7-bisphosphatase-like protein
VTETVENAVEQEGVDQREPCICESYARATERAALAAARWLGRDDQQAAEEAATSAMARTL